MEPADREVLTVDEVASRAGDGCGVELVAIHRGELPAEKKSNRYGYRILRADYERWVATPTTPQKGA